MCKKLDLQSQNLQRFWFFLRINHRDYNEKSNTGEIVIEPITIELSG